MEANYKLDEVGKMFWELHTAIQKVQDDKGLTDTDLEAVWDQLLGMPTAIRKMIAGELPDTYTIESIKRDEDRVVLGICDEGKGNTKAELVGKKIKVRVIEPEPLGRCR